MPDERPRDDLSRFSEPSLVVLVSLASGPKHGYAIMTDVEAFTGRHLGPGTLYAVLARLEASGLIEPMLADDRRQPYRLTSAGAGALRERLREIERFAALGLGRLAGLAR